MNDLKDLFLTSLQNAKYVWNKAELDAVNEAKTDYLMGKTFGEKDCLLSN